MAKNKVLDLKAPADKEETVVVDQTAPQDPVVDQQEGSELPPEEKLDLEETELDEQAPQDPVPEEVVQPRSALAQSVQAAQTGGEQLRRSLPYFFQLSEVEAYVEAMAPGLEQAPGVGATWQVRLYRAITGLTRLTGPDFRAGMDRVLELFAQHSEGALSPRLTQRWVYDLRMPKRDCDNFLRLMNIMQLAANENTRARLSEFASPTKTFADFPQEESQMFLAYFS